MTKAPKIDVITVKLTCHIPVDPGGVDSVQAAARHSEELSYFASEFGETTVETRLNRVPAPEPKPDAFLPVDAE